MLEKIGLEVVCAENGFQAVEIFSSQYASIKCVLLDMTMPVWDGEKTFYELKKISPTIKIVLSSGYTEHNIAQIFVNQGEAFFIKKPYSMEELKQCLKQVFH
jgi:DNA-binding NtrC family response regulator